jgi:WD40 repeat protein
LREESVVSGPVRQVAYHPNGEFIASASRDQTLILWDAQSGEPVHRLRGHGGDVVNLAFSPNGKRLVSVCYNDRSLKLWDIPSGQDLLSLQTDGPARSAVFSPDGQRLVAGGDEFLRVWVAEGPQPRPESE